MAFCPGCEAEYREGITVCPDCNLELVGELNDKTRLHDKSDGEPVPFQSFKTSAEAEVVRELLANNGIRAFVQGSEFAVIPGSFSQEVILMVDERDLDRATRIYEAYFDAHSSAPAEKNQPESDR